MMLFLPEVKLFLIPAGGNYFLLREKHPQF